MNVKEWKEFILFINFYFKFKEVYFFGIKRKSNNN